MGFLDDVNPFAEGNLLGPPETRSNQSAGEAVDPASYDYGLNEASPTPGESPTIPNPAAAGLPPWILDQAGVPAEIPNPNYVPGRSGLQVYTDTTRGIGQQYGEALQRMGFGTYDTGTGLVGQGTAALGADPNRLLDPSAVSGARQGIGMVDEAGRTLLGLSRQSGPSAAESMLRGATADAQRQNLALATSGRGLGGGAAARRAALAQNADLAGRMAPELATLRAREHQEDLARRAAAAGAAAGAGGASAQAQLGLGGYVTGARGQGEGLATQRGLGLIGTGVGAMGTGAGVVGQGGQTELSGQGLVGGAYEADLSAGIAKEANKTTRRGQDRALQGTEMQTEQQHKGALLGAAASAVEGAATMAAASDRRAKTGIEPVEVRATPAPGERGSASNSWVGGTELMVRDPEKRGRLVKASDGQANPSMAERYKQSILADLDDAGAAASSFAASPSPPELRDPDMPSPRAATEAVRATPGYSFRYRDPERHGEGQRAGIMAQDLERTPAGRAAVSRAPDGTRMVDTGELSTINTAALHAQEERLSRLEQALKESSLNFELPEPDTDELDRAAQRERSFGL